MWTHTHVNISFYHRNDNRKILRNAIWIAQILHFCKFILILLTKFVSNTDLWFLEKLLPTLKYPIQNIQAKCILYWKRHWAVCAKHKWHNNEDSIPHFCVSRANTHSFPVRNCSFCRVTAFAWTTSRAYISQKWYISQDPIWFESIMTKLIQNLCYPSHEFESAIFMLFSYTISQSDTHEMLLHRTETIWLSLNSTGTDYRPVSQNQRCWSNKCKRIWGHEQLVLQYNH